MKNKVTCHLASVLRVFKGLWEDDENDDKDKFYPKISKAKSSNYLEIWLFYVRKLSWRG
jgi:hypothetical protein